MARSWIVHLIVVVIASLEALVQASYYLDDTNGSIIYHGWVPYSRPGTILDIDVTRLYNGTVTLGSFSYATDMVIPFYGSGITLYSAVIYESWFNVSIDGGTPRTYHIAPVVGCCNPTIQPLYNTSVYNLTSLPVGDHELLLTCLVPPVLGDISIFYFDYAFVDTNDPKLTASVDPLSTIYPSTTSAVNPSAKPSSRSVIGPAVGGTVGGIIAISTAIFFILFCRRRRTQRADTLPIDPDPNILCNVNHIPFVGASHRPISMIINADPNTVVDHIPILGASHHPSSKDSPSTLPTGPWPNFVEQPPQSHATSAFLNPHEPHSGSSSTVPIAPDGVLATQEARFLRHLYDRDAPDEEIVELIQAIQVRKERKEANAARMMMSSRRDANAEPPVYSSQA